MLLIITKALEEGKEFIIKAEWAIRKKKISIREAEKLIIESELLDIDIMGEGKELFAKEYYDNKKGELI